jgi:hypothetical protein
MPLSRYVALNLRGSMFSEGRIFYAVPNPEDLNYIPSIVTYYITNKKMPKCMYIDMVCYVLNKVHSLEMVES